MNILLVEDKPEHADDIRDLLNQSSVDYERLVVCQTLSEAVASVHAENFDLILLDLVLPDAAGIQNVERLTRDAPGVPIIVVSDEEDPNIISLALRLGAQDFLKKSDLCAPGAVRAIQSSLDRMSRLRIIGELSVLDDATGLLNRRGMFLVAQPILDTMRRLSATMFCVVCDITNMHDLEDVSGYGPTQDVLRLVAGSLQHIFRVADGLAFLDGERFVAICVETGPGSEALQTRLFEHIQESVVPLNLEVAPELRLRFHRFEPETLSTVQEMLDATVSSAEMVRVES